MYQNPTSRVSALLLREIDPRRGNAILKQGIAAVVTGMCRTIFLLRNGRAFACGHNNSGQLGLGDNIDRTTPTEITFFQGKGSVESVAIRFWRTIFLLRDGRAFACGWNKYGELGLGDTDSRNTPTEIVFFKDRPVKSVGIGGDHTIFLLRDGRAFACEWNKYGELGLGDTDGRNIPTEITFFNGMPIEFVVAGAFHIIFLLRDGRAFACGSNHFGELGLGNNAARNTPTEITFFKNKGMPIKSVGIGACHTIFLLRDGRMFACGGNNNGQLGLGYNTARNTPMEIIFFKNKDMSIESVGIGAFHTIFLLSDGRAFACGINNCRQLGLGDNTDRTTPTEITSLNGMPIKSVVAGDDCTVFLLSDGRAFACGSNWHGELGLGDSTARNIPTEITFL